jgi:hypothetical protein
LDCRAHCCAAAREGRYFGAMVSRVGRRAISGGLLALLPKLVA